MVLQLVKMASAHYFMEGDEYVLKEDVTGLEIDRMKEVTLMIHKISGKILAHGKAAIVREYEVQFIDDIAVAEQKAGNKEWQKIALCFFQISGKLPIDILNKCLDIEGYALDLFMGRGKA